jgi:hypothetical protein
LGFRKLPEVQFSLAIATILVSVDIAIAFFMVLIQPNFSSFSVISILLILEFGIMLIAGACLMSRQPLEEKDRYDDEGNPIQSWKMALIGRRVLISSIFVILFAALFGFLDSLL